MRNYIVKLITKKYQKFRIKLYKSLSTCEITGNYRLKQPLLTTGIGNISVGDRVTFGYYPSPFFFSGYIHLEARTSNSRIRIEGEVVINNNLVIICENSITIGRGTLIGTNVEITDSDFHEIAPKTRNGGQHRTSPIVIGSNVWIGSNVKILKGVSIGENSIIANGSIVTKSIPENVIAGGFPAQVLREIPD